MYYFMMRERRSLFVTGANKGGGGEGGAAHPRSSYFAIFSNFYIHKSRKQKSFILRNV